MSERMRVVHVTGCLDVGGQEKLLVEFAKHADRDRFDLRFLSFGSRGLLADEIEAQGWPVTALGLGPGLHVGLPWRLTKLFRQWGADVVHTHNDRPLIYAAPAARLARAICIHTKHGRSAANSRRQNILAALASRCTHRFVCVSADCANLAVAQGVSRRRVLTIHNGIDTDRFAYAGPCANGPTVIVARLCPDKDIGTLLEAVALAICTAPDFRLWIAGDGPCRSELEQHARRLGLCEHVRFLGAVNDVPSLLRQARVAVLSSVSEGVSLTLLEAMASGLPVVATRVGGTAEVVADGESGVLVPSRDPVALANALVRVHADAALGREFGLAGHARVERDFEVRRMVARYEELYAAPGSNKTKEAPPCVSRI